jgi:4-hydroxybenzoate polyprenyltransferase
MATAAVVFAFIVSTATGLIAIVLVGIITAYNHSAKRVRIVGPVFMGLCRGLNFLLGVGVVGLNGISMPAIVISALLLSLFIAAVTQIASSETDRYKTGPIRWLPGVILVAWFLGLFMLVKLSNEIILIVSLLLAGLACLWAFYCGSLLVSNAPPAVVQKTIGRFLRGLLLIQAAIIALSGTPGFIAVAILLVAWPVSQKLAVRFYAS